MPCGLDFFRFIGYCISMIAKLRKLPSDHECAYFGKVDYPVYKLDIVLDDSISLEECIAKHEMNAGSKTPTTKEQQGQARRDSQRWDDYTTGNAYVLYIQNRTSDHSFRVIQHGKNVYQAVRRYYRGFTQAQDNWIWQCTKVVAVYTMLDNGMTTSGDLLCGQAQDSYPY